jgi:hypothetical protein
MSLLVIFIKKVSKLVYPHQYPGCLGPAVGAAGSRRWGVLMLMLLLSRPCGRSCSMLLLPTCCGLTTVSRLSGPCGRSRLRPGIGLHFNCQSNLEMSPRATHFLNIITRLIISPSQRGAFHIAGICLAFFLSR